MVPGDITTDFLERLAALADAPAPAWSPGLDVLNCGAGHLRYDLAHATEAEIALMKETIEDMLRRGYTVLVETKDGTTRRVKKFHADRAVYVVEVPAAAAAGTGGDPKGKGKGGKGEAEVPMNQARATGVGRAAGG